MTSSTYSAIKKSIAFTVLRTFGIYAVPRIYHKKRRLVASENNYLNLFLTRGTRTESIRTGFSNIKYQQIFVQQKNVLKTTWNQFTQSFQLKSVYQLCKDSYYLIMYRTAFPKNFTIFPLFLLCSRTFDIYSRI